MNVIEGKPYRPSNGTEGQIFISNYCDECRKQEECQIILYSMAHDIDSAEYPKQLIYRDGQPCCTEFEDLELVQIKNALTEYHHALDIREHGGVAADDCLKKIQGILNMHWIQGATLKN